MSESIRNYKYLLIIVMLYVTFDLSSLVYSYKEIKLGFVVGMASSIIFPITYIINDIVTEVYGYRIAKSVICYAIACDFVFAIVTFFISFVPSPSLHQYNAYRTKPISKSNYSANYWSSNWCLY